MLASYLLAVDHVAQEADQGRIQFADPITFGFDVPPKEAIDYFKNKKVVTRKEFDKLADDARNAAFTVSGVYRDDVLYGFKNEIAKSLETGTAQKQVIKRFKEILAGAGHRELGDFHLETVYRTNMQMSYGVGRRRALESVSDDLPFWEYHTAGDDRVRDSHRALHGIILPANDLFWIDHFPPWDFNCRCTVTARASLVDDYNPESPAGDDNIKIFYDPKGKPAKAEIDTRVIDLAVGDFRGVPPQGGLRETIKAGVERAKQKRTIESSPQGVPIGNLLKLEKAAQIVRPSISAIESVHNVKQLPAVIQVVARKLTKRTGATYDSKRMQIVVDPSRPHLPLNFFHEVGHLLDHQAFGKPGVYASEKSSAFTQWRKATQSSKAYKELEALLRARFIRQQGEAGIVFSEQVDLKYSKYLLEKAELFARSYTQFIALRSGNRELLNLIDEIRHNESDPYRFRQWSDEDFAPIAEAIERLLVKQRWLK